MRPKHDAGLPRGRDRALNDDQGRQRFVGEWVHAGNRILHGGKLTGLAPLRTEVHHDHLAAVGFHHLPANSRRTIAPPLPVAEVYDGNPPRSAGGHLPYLDDDPALVKLITRLLAKRGFTVTGFTEQTQASDALRVDPMAFDLLLTDFNMRGLSGVDVAREARAIRADLPIILVSGFVDEEARRRAIAVGVNKILSTGASAHELSRVVKLLLRPENFRDATPG